MLKKVFFVILVLFLMLVAVIAAMPDDFRYERSVLMSASPDKAFALVNDLHQWEAWSPWAKMDPNAKMTYEGAAAGVGAVTTWDGNDEVGAGKMTIVESRPDEYIKLKLEFYRPMKAENMAEFTFKPEGDDDIRVTWAMFGTSNFIGKAISLVMNCEEMVGREFEKGLAAIKRLAEKQEETKP